MGDALPYVDPRLADDTLGCWGSNWIGQLCDGSTVEYRDAPYRSAGTATNAARPAPPRLDPEARVALWRGCRL